VPAVLIRPFRVEDTHALYEVCLRTGDNGSDATAMYDDPRRAVPGHDIQP
jgi:hypothetical protein